MAIKTNKFGDLRGMMYKPKWANCDDCGAPIWKDAPNRHLCKKCQIRHQEERKRKSRERALSAYYRKQGLAGSGAETKTEDSILAMKFNTKVTLCWNCANAVPDKEGHGCSWSRRLIPVEGWTVQKKTNLVLECPEYVCDREEVSE